MAARWKRRKYAALGSTILALGFAATALFLFSTPRDRILMASTDLLELPVPHPARIADRLSVVMRGIPASIEEKQKFQDGTVDLKQLAENYRSDERFAERLAQYWAQVLKITAPFDFAMIEDSEGNSLLKNLRPAFSVSATRSLIFRKPNVCANSDAPRFELYYRIQATQEEVDALERTCATKTEGSQERQTCDNALATTRDRLAVTNNFRDTHDCSCSEAIEVRPWWNPSSTVRVCPSAITACPMNNRGKCTNTSPGGRVQICGENLAQCMPHDSRIDAIAVHGFLNPLQHDGNRFFDDVMTGLTLEPAMLIAKTIQENADYRQILTTSNTVLNGAAETFLKSRQGEMLSKQSAGKFNDAATLIADQSERKSWRRVERGTGNAGILTTPMFHQVTNGYRAKANRAYESFLCRKFTIPPGVVDSQPDEIDLTKRQPCASCHVELEPLGAMFKRWPVEGNNFLYAASDPATGGFHIQPGGKFEAGEDVAGIGNLFVKDERFAECAVQRAFEFIVGREPSEYDVELFFPKWKQKFLSEGYRVWPVMLEIVESVYFRGGWK